MAALHPRPAPSDGNEITADLGIDDIILSYRSEYWITPRLDDGVQQWDIGMHFTEDGPGPQFGSIRLHLVDHERCLEPIDALDALSEDLFTIGQALFDPSVLGVRQDLWDRFSVPGNTVIVDRVTIDSRLRGHGLGVFLTGMALDYLSSSTGVIALFPGPVERTRPHPPRRSLCPPGAGLVPARLRPLPRRCMGPRPRAHDPGRCHCRRTAAPGRSPLAGRPAAEPERLGQRHHRHHRPHDRIHPVIPAPAFHPDPHTPPCLLPRRPPGRPDRSHSRRVLSPPLHRS